MKKMILIDGNFWLFSCYYATAAMGNLMVNKDGVPTNGVYGFAQRLGSVLKENPDYVVVAFDAKGKTFRSDMLEQYKENRKETPQELTCQFPMVKEFLDAYQIQHLELTGYEGDDIIGTIANKASKEGIEVHIYTNDKDMMQLVNESVHQYKKPQKSDNYNIITPTSFYEEYGISCDQMRDLLGLMGDTADNIPGITGVGPKTAIKLIKEYETVENLKEHSDELKGKIGQTIREQIDMAILSKELATIDINVPLEYDLESSIYQPYDYEKLAAFYRRYDMQSLLKRISLQKTQTPIKTSNDIKPIIVQSLPPINKDSALTTCTYEENYHKSLLLGFGIYNEDQAYYISIENALKDASFLAFCKNKDIKKYGYDIKRSITSSLWHTIEIENYTFDLQLASYILSPGLKDEMRSVCEYYQYYDVAYDEEVFGKGAKKCIPSDEILANHMVKKAKAIYLLRQLAVDKLKAEQQYDLYQEIEMPVSRILAQMEYTGAKVDLDFLKQLEQSYGNKIKELEKDIHSLVGKEFNIASPKQLGEVLFVDLGLPSSKKTKTGFSTSVEVLNNLVDIHPVIKKILDYRSITKLYSTYIIGLQEQVFADGKIHTMYNQALTLTGRLSSTDPNLQNIPVKTPEGKDIRKAFIPSNDYLVSYDYSQIELRILAHMAECPSLIQAFNDDQDIHAYTASQIFHVALDKVDDTMRRHAKAINFGIVYGMSDFGLSKQIDSSVNEAKRFIENYFTKYPEIESYMKTNIQKCKELGYVETMFLRRRYIPEINEKNFMRQELGKRLAMNSPIQGTGADIMKLAMIKVDQLFKENNLQSKMILQVHDELIFDVKSEEVEKVMELVQLGMEQAASLNVDLKVEGNYAKSWYDLK
ncbi:DNA polymerase I [Tannockella kyphosi]|uniref:DNA polymerase I n=1 Tax=Tannockella kyphosi TaxID=2899121 RepID=UPI002011DA8F|nr:DNA polymerase I [Tannockella kyphosi]